jgi:hypothetical protein
MLKTIKILSKIFVGDMANEIAKNLEEIPKNCQKKCISRKYSRKPKNRERKIC